MIAPRRAPLRVVNSVVSLILSGVDRSQELNGVAHSSRPFRTRCGRAAFDGDVVYVVKPRAQSRSMSTLRTARRSGRFHSSPVALVMAGGEIGVRTRLSRRGQ